VRPRALPIYRHAKAATATRMLVHRRSCACSSNGSTGEHSGRMRQLSPDLARREAEGRSCGETETERGVVCAGPLTSCVLVGANLVAPPARSVEGAFACPHLALICS